MLVRIKNVAINWTPSLLKNLGFGLALTGAQDRANEEDFSAYNIAAMTIGAVAWIAGACLEYRSAPNPETCRNSTSTKVIQQTLSHSAGLALVNTIANGIKDHSFNSSTFQRALFLSTPGGELNLSETKGFLIPGVQWETLRFLILSAGGYFSYSGLNNVYNGDKDILSIISIPLGLALMLGELLYSVKMENESPKSLLNLNRKILKTYSGATSILAVLDMIANIRDKYAVENDAFAILTNILMYASFIQMHQLSKNSPRLDVTVASNPNRFLNADAMAIIPPPTVLDISEQSEQKQGDEYTQFGSSSRLSPM